MEDRLQILLNSSVINEKTYKNSLNIYEKYFKKKNYDKDKVSVFMTHFAMALSRVENNQMIEKLDEHVFKQVIESQMYEMANNIWISIKKDLLESGIIISENEQGYFLLHLANIFNLQN
ncbi:PRD domain-containing protein [Helcococcus ovis]|uniref:PRD domain-containing protein n=1 Tax=Helcococcus ovis TaxID=72026 RepID=A0A4R9C2N4_9FIRM|nr:PRD domain-containing protein [Helcococcus ovis]TFF66197.1 PRD domain-containing protein [Helcococcus ovis]TFF67324.1 PRD domain-containing protein [Helcococcus ovis]